MSYVMNPQQVKRREYMGLAAIALGVITGLTGLITVLFSMPVGLIFLSFGLAVGAAGVFVLVNIPDVEVVGPLDDFR